MMVIVKNFTKIFTNLRIVLNIVLIQLDSQGVQDGQCEVKLL